MGQLQGKDPRHPGVQFQTDCIMGQVPRVGACEVQGGERCPVSTFQAGVTHGSFFRAEAQYLRHRSNSSTSVLSSRK